MFLFNYIPHFNYYIIVYFSSYPTSYIHIINLLTFFFFFCILVPPEPPLVLNRWGRQLNGTILGPMEEGDDIMLTCRVVGGK